MHFTNLTALNNWIKSAFASVTAVAILVLVSPLVCSNCFDEPSALAAASAAVRLKKYVCSSHGLEVKSDTSFRSKLNKALSNKS